MLHGSFVRNTFEVETNVVYSLRPNYDDLDFFLFAMPPEPPGRPLFFFLFCGKHTYTSAQTQAYRTSRIDQLTDTGLFGATLQVLSGADAHEYVGATEPQM